MSDLYDLVIADTRHAARRTDVRAARGLARAAALEVRREGRRHAIAGRLRGLADRLEN